MKTEKVISLIQKYKGNIYTRQGEINLRTTRSIALEAGLKNPNVFRGRTLRFVFINDVCIDPYGEASKEVESIYEFCCRLKEKEEKDKDATVEIN